MSHHVSEEQELRKHPLCDHASWVPKLLALLQAAQNLSCPAGSTESRLRLPPAVGGRRSLGCLSLPRCPQSPSFLAFPALRDCHTKHQTLGRNQNGHFPALRAQYANPSTRKWPGPLGRAQRQPVPLPPSGAALPLAARPWRLRQPPPRPGARVPGPRPSPAGPRRAPRSEPEAPPWSSGAAAPKLSRRAGEFRAGPREVTPGGRAGTAAAPGAAGQRAGWGPGCAAGRGLRAPAPGRSRLGAVRGWPARSPGPAAPQVSARARRGVAGGAAVRSGHSPREGGQPQSAGARHHPGGDASVDGPGCPLGAGSPEVMPLRPGPPRARGRCPPCGPGQDGDVERPRRVLSLLQSRALSACSPAARCPAGRKQELF
ncbi:collagen alpha-1(I) chain-like [Cavia porcellus]|uniref:collagen alpha-1(I) chain-like n=1 Tax=Cavia porcellus TaxID=10141 RepID=UPI002FDF2F54